MSRFKAVRTFSCGRLICIDFINAIENKTQSRDIFASLDDEIQIVSQLFRSKGWPNNRQHNDQMQNYNEAKQNENNRLKVNRNEVARNKMNKTNT